MPEIILDCLSDTHNRHALMGIPTPVLAEGDQWILVHAGDATIEGKAKETRVFARWLQLQPHHHKVVIVGNHELRHDPVHVQEVQTGLEQLAVVYEAKGEGRKARKLRSTAKDYRLVDGRAILGRVSTYLHGRAAEVAGLRFWGSPYSLRFRNWAFQVDAGEASRAMWAEIPEGTDVVVVHGPPYGHGDRCPDMRNEDHWVSVGCPDLLARIREVRPKVCVFGHIHQSAGVTRDACGTLMVNAACVGVPYFVHEGFYRLRIQESGEVLINFVRFQKPAP